ncbi:MAG TPA: NfeD family protein [Bacteroidetes bacterium]|nr:NfeD family protein [Bacteroidota bacterium]
MDNLLSAWLLWFILAVILLIGEIFTPGFLLACFSLGAFGSGLVALLGGNLTFQLIVFGIVTIVIFFTIRPLMMRLAKKSESTVKTNVDALVGRYGKVVAAIDPDANSGRVRIGGEDWWAVTEDETPVPEGARVIVLRVDGSKLIVRDAREEGHSTMDTQSDNSEGGKQ